MTASPRRPFSFCCLLFLLLNCGYASAVFASSANEQIIEGLVADDPLQPFESSDSRGMELPDESTAHPSKVGGASWWETVLEQLIHESKAARCEDGTCRTHVASQGMTLDWDA